MQCAVLSRMFSYNDKCNWYSKHTSAIEAETKKQLLIFVFIIFMPRGIEVDILDL